MVLDPGIFHPIRRRCIYCSEFKNIPVDARPICKECLMKRKNKNIYYGKIILIVLLALLLIIFITL